MKQSVYSIILIIALMTLDLSAQGLPGIPGLDLGGPVILNSDVDNKGGDLWTISIKDDQGQVVSIAELYAPIDGSCSSIRIREARSQEFIQAFRLPFSISEIKEILQGKQIVDGYIKDHGVFSTYIVKEGERTSGVYMVKFDKYLYHGSLFPNGPKRTYDPSYDEMAYTWHARLTAGREYIFNDINYCYHYLNPTQPEHRGYAKECVKKLKERVDALEDKFSEGNDDVDEFGECPVEEGDGNNGSGSNGNDNNGGSNSGSNDGNTGSNGSSSNNGGGN